MHARTAHGPMRTAALLAVAMLAPAAAAGASWEFRVGDAPLVTAFTEWTSIGALTLDSATALGVTVAQAVVAFGTGTGFELRLLGPGVDAYLIGAAAGFNLNGQPCPTVTCESVVRQISIAAGAGDYALLANGATNREYTITVSSSS